MFSRRFFADNGEPNRSNTDTSARCTELAVQFTLAITVHRAHSISPAAVHDAMAKTASLESEMVSDATYRWNSPHAQALPDTHRSPVTTEKSSIESVVVLFVTIVESSTEPRDWHA